MIIVVIASNFVPLLTIIVTALILASRCIHPLAGALLVVAGTRGAQRCFEAVCKLTLLIKLQLLKPLE